MKKLPLSLIFLSLLLAGITGYYLFHKEEQDAPLILYGNVDIRQVDLGFRVPGKLQSMLFEEGESVNKGDTLALLDQTPLSHELRAAEARVAKNRALLEKLQNGPRPQEIKTARAQVEEAEAVYDNAHRNFNRQKELFSDNATSRIALDQATAHHDEAAARLSAARERYALIQEGARFEDIHAGQAGLQEAIAQKDLVAASLQDCVLKAPLDGTILTRIREPGAIITTGTAVYSLSIDSPVYVRAYVDEVNLGNITPGQKVTISTDTNETIYNGTIGYISPRAEFTPKSVETPDLRTALVYRLRIVVEENMTVLRQGMPVTIHFP
jgi:HlyD family secretion protein